MRLVYILRRQIHGPQNLHVVRSRPVEEKYPSVTGYCYTMDNPIGLMDQQEWLQKYPTIKENNVYGMKHILELLETIITCGYYSEKTLLNISFGKYTATDGETGKITLTKGK